MVAVTDPPYCLVYLKIYESHVPKKERNHPNVQGSPPGPWIHECMCHTLLQLIDKSPKNQQKHHDGCVVIPQGTQCDRLLPEVVRPCNHQSLLIDLNTKEAFPMVSVGDFALEDNIFPGSPGDSLLYTHDELDKLQKKGYQVAKHRPPAPPAKISQPPWCSGEGHSSTCEGGESAKVAGPLDKKSSHTKCSPSTKVCQEAHDIDSSTSKHREKS